MILNRCRYNLVSSDHQFGFKEKHSTDMAVYVLKEVIDHYLRNRSPVFVCFLDTRKAFDRVNHWILFDKLLRRACLLTSCDCLRHGMNRRNFTYCGVGVLRKVFM